MGKMVDSLAMCTCCNLKEIYKTNHISSYKYSRQRNHENNLMTKKTSNSEEKGIRNLYDDLCLD